MQLNKIEMDLLKALQKNPAAVSYATDIDKLFIGLDYEKVVYVLPEEILVSPNGASASILLFDTYREANEKLEEELLDKLTPTDEYRQGGGTQKFVDPSGHDVYIPVKRLERFDHPTLYLMSEYSDYVVVTEAPFNDAESVVGFVLPVKMEND